MRYKSWAESAGKIQKWLQMGFEPMPATNFEHTNLWSPTTVPIWGYRPKGHWSRVFDWGLFHILIWMRSRLQPRHFCLYLLALTTGVRRAYRFFKAMFSCANYWPSLMNQRVSEPCNSADGSNTNEFSQQDISCCGDSASVLRMNLRRWWCSLYVNLKGNFHWGRTS